MRIHVYQLRDQMRTLYSHATTVKFNSKFLPNVTPSDAIKISNTKLILNGQLLFCAADSQHSTSILPSSFPKALSCYPLTVTRITSGHCLKIFRPTNFLTLLFQHTSYCTPLPLFSLSFFPFGHWKLIFHFLSLHRPGQTLWNPGGRVFRKFNKIGTWRW